ANRARQVKLANKEADTLLSPSYVHPAHEVADHSLSAGLVEPPVSGHDAAAVSGGQREVETIIDRNTVPDGHVECRLSPAPGRVVLDRHSREITKESAGRLRVKLSATMLFPQGIP